MSSDKVGIGILGCAGIARKNSRAMLRASNVELRAVASRSIEKCETWCAKMRLPASVARLGAYEELIARPDVQVVYAPLPTSTHLEWIPKIASAGKHIIVEKPVGRTASEVAEIIRSCRTHGVRLMDGTMFLHHERFDTMRRYFEDELLWEPLRVTSAFTFDGPKEFLENDIRCKADGDPLGCLGDLGWYCIRNGIAAFRHEVPKTVAARMSAATSEGVPLDMDVEVFFDAKAAPGSFEPRRLLTFHCSFLTPFRQWFEAVSRHSKIIRCDDFVIPRREQQCQFEMEESVGLADFDCLIVAEKSSISTIGCTQEVKLMERMADIVTSGQSTTFFEEGALLTHRIMDAAMESARRGGEEVPLPDVAI